jgi:hypothetical protein
MSNSTQVESRPWEMPIWKPVRGKENVLLYLITIDVLAVIGVRSTRFSFTLPEGQPFTLNTGRHSIAGFEGSLYKGCLSWSAGRSDQFQLAVVRWQ